MPNHSVALFAGGCFWGMEELFRAIPGVLDTEVGYSGGSLVNPTYYHVKMGNTGHAETLQITFDSALVSYETLVEFFYKIHDPTTLNRQGNDLGSQYRSAIFYLDDQQKQIAEMVTKRVEESGFWNKPIVTEITKAGPFYNAEPEHQDYLQRYPDGYTCHYIRS